MNARPDPRGPDELKAATRLEARWAENAAGIAAAARAKAAAGFWYAVESRRGGSCSPKPGNVTHITAARRPPSA